MSEYILKYTFCQFGLRIRGCPWLPLITFRQLVKLYPDTRTLSSALGRAYGPPYGTNGFSQIQSFRSPISWISGRDKACRVPLPLRGNFGVLRRPNTRAVLPRGYPPALVFDGAIFGVCSNPFVVRNPSGQSADNPRTFTGRIRAFSAPLLRHFSQRESLPGGRFFLSGRISPLPPSDLSELAWCLPSYNGSVSPCPLFGGVLVRFCGISPRLLYPLSGGCPAAASFRHLNG